MSPLDLETIQAFVAIADLGSFTRAAEALGTTQSTISLKLKRLEQRLNRTLILRSPRHVSLSPDGAAFIENARQLLIQHDKTLAALTGARRRLIVGISDHVAGPELPRLIARMNNRDPDLVIEIRIGSSEDLLKRFDRREMSTVIIRQHDCRSDGRLLATEKFQWFAEQNWQHRANEPLPIATMPEPCSVRIAAGTLLDNAGIAWREVFVGGGVTAISAAVMAGIGISPLARRMLPLGVVDVGPRLGLPELPSLPIILHSRAKDRVEIETIESLATAYKGVVNQ